MAAALDTLTAGQCREARELLGWTRLDLALAAEIRVTSVLRLEDGRRPPAARKAARFRSTLEAAGVDFLADGTMRLRAALDGG